MNIEQVKQAAKEEFNHGWIACGMRVVEVLEKYIGKLPEGFLKDMSINLIISPAKIL